MKLAVEYTQYLNPGQIAIGCSDQPLYALKKRDGGHCRCFFARYCRPSTAVCDVNNIKKDRYTLQVIAAILMRNMQEAYEESEVGSGNNGTFQQWTYTQHMKILTNPFSHAHFCRLNSTYWFPEVIIHDSERVFTQGGEQYQEYCLTHFVNGSQDLLKSKITKNMLKLPKDHDTRTNV